MTPQEQFCPVWWMSLIGIRFHLINDLSWLFPPPTFPFRSWIKCDPLSLNAFPPSLFPIRVESQLLRTHYKAPTQPLNISPPQTHTLFFSSAFLISSPYPRLSIHSEQDPALHSGKPTTAYKDKLSTRIGFSNDYRDSWGPSYLKKYKGSSLGF